MINREELAICERRGHDERGGAFSLHEGWVQCKWCNAWIREVRTRELREDEPPEEEKNPLPGLRRRIQEIE